MGIIHRAITIGYPILRTARYIASSIGWLPRDVVRVLIVHDVAPDQQAHFRRQLTWLSKSWNFISPTFFQRVLSGEEKPTGRNLLLTFDDGFISNRIVAEEILRPLGISAIFFAISNFTDLVDTNDAHSFISTNIQPGTAVEDVPPHLRNMQWDDLEALLKQGHTIGAHTATHARLSQVHDEALAEEIITSADKIETRLGVAIQHFAYTFGNLASFSQEALAVASRRFPYIYSGLRGDNTPDTSPLCIRRDAISPGDSLYHIGSLLAGATDVYYQNGRKQLDHWADEITVAN